MDKIRFNIALEDVKFSIEDNASGLPKLSGYAMVWNKYSSDRGGYVVKLLPYSAKPSGNVFALYNHDSGQVLGCSNNGTLTCTPDAYGLKVSINPSDTTYGRDCVALVRRGDCGGMSFGMLAGGTYADKKENATNVREFSSFEYDEVTITPIPAFDDTTIGAAFNAKVEEPVVAKVEAVKVEVVKTPIRNIQELKLEELRWQLANR